MLYVKKKSHGQSCTLETMSFSITLCIFYTMLVLLGTDAVAQAEVHSTPYTPSQACEFGPGVVQKPCRPAHQEMVLHN